MAPGETILMRDLKFQHLDRLKNLGLKHYDPEEGPPTPPVITEPAPIPEVSPSTEKDEGSEEERDEEEKLDTEAAIELLMEKNKDELIDQASELDLPTYGTKMQIAERIVEKVGADFLGT
jgi:hypothetical protein